MSEKNWVEKLIKVSEKIVEKLIDNGEKTVEKGVIQKLRKKTMKIGMKK